MAVRRHGSIVAFWGTQTTPTTTPVAEAALAGAFSRKILTGQDDDQVVIYVSTSGATTIQIYVAHASSLTPDGNEPDYDSPPADAWFYPLYYTNTQQQLAFAGAGTAALSIPDWVAPWVTLKTSNAVNLIAGIDIGAT